MNVDGKETSVETVNIGGFNFCSVRKLVGFLGASVILENGKIFIKNM